MKKPRLPRPPRAPKVRTVKGKGPKKVNYELISDTLDEPGRTLYALLRDLVRKHHPDLRAARIAVAWAHGWKADDDGHRTLGKLKKASDLDRELMAFDFVMMLNRPWWIDVERTIAEQTALVDHELMHGALKHDARGEPIEDERGRKVYRIRRHDYEEFNDIIARHGIWIADLERTYQAMREGAARGWQPDPACCADTDTPGWVEAADDTGVARRDRCRCWTAHFQRANANAAEGRRAAQPRLVPPPGAAPTIN